MAANRSGSILAVDFGNVHTRAVLIDVVEGRYQLVAQAETRTTAGFPHTDIGVGLRRALDDITVTTGRKLLVPGNRIISPEQADRSGVDSFLATASIGRPLRTVLIGLVPDVSLASGLRATAGTYVHVVETLTLADERGEEGQVNAIVMSRPDLIFITGGTEDGAREPVLQLARVARLALQLITAQRKPPVLFAGNGALVPDMRSMFEGLTALFVAPNIRPSLADEELEAAQLQLALAYDASAAQRGAGFERVGNMSRLGVLPTAQSYNLMVDYMGRASGAGLLAVDVGSAASTLAARLGGRIGTSIRTDIGLGHSARGLLEAVGVEAVRAWIPFHVTRDDLLTYALDKSLRPGVVPETIRDLYLEHAFLRAGIRAMVRASAPTWDKSLADGAEGTLPPFERVIGAGAAITNTGRPGLSAMLLLDALAPVGVVTLLMDSAALIPALGALAHVNPAAVVQVLDTGGLDRLGVSFNVSGSPRVGRRTLSVKITPEDGRGVVSRDIDGGTLWIYPLLPGMKARVDIHVIGRGLDIGGKTRLKLDVEGGGAGLIFDARGRPLPLAADVRTRATQMPAWLAQATGDAVHDIDPKWLQPPSDDGKAPAPERGRKATAVKPAQASKSKGGTGQLKSKGDTGKLKGKGDTDKLKKGKGDTDKLKKGKRDTDKLKQKQTNSRLKDLGGSEEEEDFDELRNLLS